MAMRAASSRPLRGFTFLDVMIALVIVGVGIAAIAQFMTSGTAANGAATRLTIGLNLARNVHEYALMVSQPIAVSPWIVQPGGDITALQNWTSKNNTTTTGDKMITETRVINSSGKGIDGLAEWEQRCVIYSVDPANATTNLAGAPTAAGARRLVVTVLYRSKSVCTQDWIIAPSRNLRY